MQADAKELLDRIWEETTKVVEKFQNEAKGFISNFKHYNKVEIGLYAALALSLTVALKSKYLHIWNATWIAMSILENVFLMVSFLGSTSMYSFRLYQGSYQDIGFSYDYLYSQLTSR